MRRYFVCRAYFKWKGKMYYKGDLLPESFTHHDQARSIYGSRVGVCEVPDEESSATLTPDKAPSPIMTPLTGAQAVKPPAPTSPPEVTKVAPVANSIKGTPSAANSTFNFKIPPTGTSK